MYYLTVQNLGVTRCIHSGWEDVYRDGMTFSCTPDLEFPGGKAVKEVNIVCSEVPHSTVKAVVYWD